MKSFFEQRMAYMHQRIDECERAGHHIGTQHPYGRIGGRYSSRVSVRCGHCGAFYERFMTREESEHERRVFETEINI
jgi:hypothetical protein